MRQFGMNETHEEAAHWRDVLQETCVFCHLFACLLLVLAKS